MKIRVLAGLTLALSILLALAAPGCRSTRRTESGPAAENDDPKMEHTMAGSDAERAKAALERNHPSGERRPATPKRRPVVDQPRSNR